MRGEQVGMLLQNWQRATISRTSVPRCRLFTVEQESSLGASLHLHPPKAGFQPYTSRSSMHPRPRSFKGPFWPSKGFPIELCILQLLFAAQQSTATSTAELCRIAFQERWAGPGRILPLANYLDLSSLPPSTPTKLQACL